ncbi:MAG: hypothetical protein UY48_C0011G0029 [Candidatus Gottesmanbacteria bacterium GW2011_GWB1_49_7]|uniref:Uncharacterized protein n=1 Tax=Candidatus Gottesmanbacteria bacterium GW2011_GWB1_49_7 TaxID=1618448 RepID=A0A0G1YC81_9BACT|nr:MAG: hypothetical protein UY48_C0011G0029 [Candidatus Gottesmanbacteria bacterium GW2011_GWB1_49_7]
MENNTINGIVPLVIEQPTRVEMRSQEDFLSKLIRTSEIQKQNILLNKESEILGSGDMKLLEIIVNNYNSFAIAESKCYGETKNAITLDSQDKINILKSSINRREAHISKCRKISDNLRKEHALLNKKWHSYILNRKRSLEIDLKVKDIDELIKKLSKECDIIFDLILINRQETTVKLLELSNAFHLKINEHRNTILDNTKQPLYIITSPDPSNILLTIDILAWAKSSTATAINAIDHELYTDIKYLTNKFFDAIRSTKALPEAKI